MTQSAEKLLNLKQKYAEQLKKSLKHLEYSYKKSTSLSMIEKEMTEETWESFSSRFTRVIDT